MSTHLHIRPAAPSDCAGIAALLSALNQSEGYDVVADASQIESALFASSREVQLRALVVDGGAGVILYYAGYDTLSATYGYHLADMVVVETKRRCGIGRALVRALAVQALAEDKEWISLTVLRKNETARAFYTSLGMSEVAVDFFAMGKTALARV